MFIEYFLKALCSTRKALIATKIAQFRLCIYVLGDELACFFFIELVVYRMLI